MKSIQREMLVRIFGCTVLLLLAASIFVGVIIRKLDISELDNALETKARILATLVLQSENTIKINFAGEYMPEFERLEKPEYFQFRMHNGSTIERSVMLKDQDLPFFPDTIEAPTFTDINLPDGRKGRFVQISFPPRAEDKGHTPSLNTSEQEQPSIVLGVACSREELDEMLLSLYITSGIMDILLVGLIIFFVNFAMSKGFLPLSVMNAQIRDLDTRALNKRIHIPAAPIELQTIISTLNGFIERLQATFERERLFSSNVAHELRTPVAELRTACEVGAKWADDPVLVRKRFESLLDSALNMERIVQNLLELSHCDKNEISTIKSNVSIAILINDCWQRSHSEVNNKQLRIENKVHSDIVINTNPNKFEMIILNLINNAASYSLPETSVVCTCTNTDKTTHLCISNHTKGLNSEDIKHLFDRFWRKDTARTTGQHSGLGLSIVETLTNALEMKVDINLNSNNIFVASISFPSKMLL